MNVDLGLQLISEISSRQLTMQKMPTVEIAFMVLSVNTHCSRLSAELELAAKCIYYRCINFFVGVRIDLLQQEHRP